MSSLRTLFLSAKDAGIPSHEAVTRSPERSPAVTFVEQSDGDVPAKDEWSKNPDLDASLSVYSWLQSTGLEHHAHVFEAAGLSVGDIVHLQEDDLRTLGIPTLGARRRIFLASQNLLNPATTSPKEASADDRPSTLSSEGSRVGALLGDITNFFRPLKPRSPAKVQPVATGNGILRFFGNHQGINALAGVKSNAGPGPGHPLARSSVPPQSTRPRRGTARVLPIRPWQLIPGTSFLVDRFDCLPPSLPQHRHWFLTHFHADHYKGLSKRFDRGLIHCTPSTAALVRQQLGVAGEKLRPHALNEPFELEGTRVTFVDANHCPGAAMILFEDAAGSSRRPVLHTGDCRLTKHMQANPLLLAFRNRADLILDTTYCDPQYDFPPQEEVLSFVVDAVKAEAFNPKTLFLFGSYTIGKERVFLEAAKALNQKVYVSQAKYKVLQCLDLAPELQALLTTNDQEAHLHTVPLWMISQQHMAKLLKHYRGRFSTVVGFKPTGWSHEKAAGQTRARGRKQQRGTIITYQVPYSEHSSFNELQEFVRWFRPLRIVPSVNSDNHGPKEKALMDLLTGTR